MVVGDGVGCAGGGGGAGFSVKVAEPSPLKSSEARPSPDKTDTPEYEMVADPVVIGTKVMIASVMFEPFNPGRGWPPVKVMVPALLSNRGFITQSETAEPEVEIELTCSLPAGKVIEASTALAIIPFVLSLATTLKLAPTVPEPVTGEKNRSAA